MIFETHAHYDDEKFDEDRAELLSSMQENGIGRIINLSANLESLENTRKLMEAYPFIYDTLRVMKEEKSEEIGGVIHCFSYSVEMAEEYLKMGFYLGIGGVVTFKNAKKIKEVVQMAPMERILLETDSPYLAPVPYRGKRNSSLYLPYVVQEIAELKGISEEEVIETTEKNAVRLFRAEE